MAGTNFTYTEFTAGDAIVASQTNANNSAIDTSFTHVLDGTDTHTNFQATGTVSLSGATTLSGVTTLSGSTTISGVIQGASPLVFEGATANAFETTLAVTDPTADRTITLPDASGTVAFTSSDITGNAATATAATDATNTTNVALLDDSSDTTCFPVFAKGATGNKPLKTDASALTYNASNGTLSATSLAGTLTTATQTNITSVGTLGSLAVTNAVSANNISLAAGASVSGSLTTSNGSASTPSHSFISDTGNGMYLSATDKVSIATGGVQRTEVSDAGNFELKTSGATYLAVDPGTGAGVDADWISVFGVTFGLKRNSSLAAEKENISADLGTHLTANMIDSVVPKMWNRITAPGIPEIGPIAEDMDAISPFLAAKSYDANGDPELLGINRNSYLSLMVLAIKDLRERMEAVEAA